MEIKPAYITIVEGPPPEFHEVITRWPSSILEGTMESRIALVEMRTFNGPKLVDRCQNAWQDGRPAYFDFPMGDGVRGELEIVATKWEEVSEGHKLFLWVRLDDTVELEEGFFDDGLYDDDEGDDPFFDDDPSFGGGLLGQF